ncbi:MAG: leucine-rich repeat protein, partial [Oscillospiraceae bacterium]|nr:leucine-rich repeat protein [Oscillospiraceae bacterium]
VKENNTHFSIELIRWKEILMSDVIRKGENTFQIFFKDGTEITYTLPQQTVGVCGEDAVWELQDNGTLVISGSGAMIDYSTSNPAPWQHLREEITAVTVEQGITHIGANAFQACSQLQAVMIANSITDIGQAAFAACDQLNLIHYMDGTKTDWQQITIADQNDSLLQTELCCQYDNQAYLYPFLSCHRGDTNGDNNIAVEDAVEILTAYAERAAGLPISLSAYQEKAADVDGDGQITVEDAVYTLTYYAKKSAGMITSWKDAGVSWSSPLAGYTAYDLMSVSRSDFLSGVDWNFVETGTGTKSPFFFGYTISYYGAYYGYTDFTAEKIQYPKSIRIEYGNITANTQVGMSYSELIATLGEPTYYSYSGENGKDIISYEMEHMRISLFLDSHTVSEGMAGDCSEIDQEAAAERVAAQNPSIYSAYIVSTNR